jgi:hypothetical protein
VAEQTESRDQAAGQESNGGHRNAMQVAAIAAATGAAALAARKAFSGRDQSGQGSQGSGSDDQSMLVAMASSGWNAARGSLQPFAEEAAGAAGEWVGRNGPDYVRETLVPRFIRGFESASSSQSE